MFWGLIMEPKRRYTQVVKRPFHISMAALDIHSSADSPCQVLLNNEDRNYLLCTLEKNKDVQVPLDLNFEAGTSVSFVTNGESNVHLTGYLVDDALENLDEESEEEEEEVNITKKRKLLKKQEQPVLKKSKTEELLNDLENYNSEDDESFSLSQVHESDSEEEDDDEENDLGEEDQLDEELEMNEESNEEDSNDDEDKIQEEEIKQNGLTPSKKGSVNVNVEKKSKGEKKLRKQSTQDSNTKSDKPSPQKARANETPEQNISSSNKRFVTGGVQIQDLVVGEGKPIKPGRIAEVAYIGRLKKTNKVFDQTRNGALFKFRLGRQEVIRGWDVGVTGMKVGGKRKIICPSAMAYGEKGAGAVIPPNSALVFEIELKNVK